MIIRRRLTANFTTISNALVEDQRLEADEIGVLAYLLSRPNDWEVRRPQLAKHFRVGRDSIKRIIFNSMRCGWISAKRTRLSNGTYHTIYEVRDQPGPTLTPEDVRKALSLVSSEALDADEDDVEAAIPTAPDDPPESDPPPTPQPGAVDQLRQTRPGPIEDLLKTDSVKPESTNGARAFADVLKAWPPDHVLSAIKAESHFASLTDGQKEDCYRGQRPYLDDCAAQTRIICDLGTFIRERRFERFTRRDAPAAHFLVKPGTPQMFRWREYLVAMEPTRVGFFDKMLRDSGHYATASEWPPPIRRKIDAQ